MEISLLFLVSACFSVLGAVIFRLELMYRNACRKIGREIVSNEYLSVNPNGYQNAITNPKRNKFFLLGVVLIIASPFFPILGSENANYWVLLISFFSMIFVGVGFSKKLSIQHYYLPIIYADLIQRVVKFEKNGDVIRSKAAKDVANLMLERYEPLSILNGE